MYAFISNVEQIYNDNPDRAGTYKTDPIFVANSLPKLKKAIIKYYVKNIPFKEQDELSFNKDDGCNAWGCITEKYSKNIVGWIEKIKLIK